MVASRGPYIQGGLYSGTHIRDFTVIEWEVGVLLDSYSAADTLFENFTKTF